VELNSNSGKVTFQVLQLRLIAFINGRIQNGDFTERGLARIIGISQPQIHNVLKGARKLRPELADRLIRKFEMSVLDLLEPGEIYEQVLLRGPIQVSKESPTPTVAGHLPPKRFSDTRPPKKPAEQELQSSKARAGHAS
jgi:hypothetical protein